MKRFITAMLFSLTVIVCEQQTLFAPHYYDLGVFNGVTSKTSPRNTLVPIAGVDRLVPVASSFANTDQVDCFVTSNVDLASTTNDCPNIMHPPGFKSRVPVAGYDCQGKGEFVTDSGDEEDDPFWDALPPDVYAGER